MVFPLPGGPAIKRLVPGGRCSLSTSMGVSSSFNVASLEGNYLSITSWSYAPFFPKMTELAVLALLEKRGGTER